ncbi:MAG: RHS repeat-associated core domain-containing protein [Candidatus Methanofastidiosia archaeon]
MTGSEKLKIFFMWKRIVMISIVLSAMVLNCCDCRMNLVIDTVYTDDVKVDGVRQCALQDGVSSEEEWYGHTEAAEYEPLEIHSDGKSGLTAASPYYKVFFAEGKARMVIGDAWIEIGLKNSDVGEAKPGEVLADKNEVSVCEVFEGVDYHYTVGDEVLAGELVLKEVTDIQEIVYQVDWKGLTPVYENEGGILFCDDEGENVVEILAPSMRDAAGIVSTDIRYELIETESGYELHKVIDEEGVEWLKNAVYPVMIDPSLQTFQNAWTSSGLTPFGQYFQNLAEYVNPANGHLTITQTDLVIPGRGLDLVISRVYETPALFYEMTPYMGQNPYNYEEPPVNVGKGWQLDLPYVGQQYLHLWGGTLYKISWVNNIFANHKGTHFILVKNGDNAYTLTTVGGTVYQFSAAGKVKSITDLDQNTITFSYTDGVLTSITDTIGRTVSFSYSGGRLWKVSYNGNELEYSYDIYGCLVWMEDFLNRRTSYYYNTGYNYWLLSKIEYLTGAYSTYTYNRFSDGSYYRYYVTNQRVYETAQVRHFAYSYTGSFEEITASAVTVKNEADTIQGFYDFTINDNVMTERVVKNAAGTPIRKVTCVYNSRDEIIEANIYNDGYNLSYTMYCNYDNWGNLIYFKDADGHERFFSYSNTSTSGFFMDTTGSVIRTFTNDFSNSTVPSSVHTVLLGAAEKQDATYVREVYLTYNGEGHATESSTSFGNYTGYLTFSGTFNEYTGDTSFPIDLTGHAVAGNAILEISGLPSDPVYQESHSGPCQGQCPLGCKAVSGSWGSGSYVLDYQCCRFDPTLPGESCTGSYTQFVGPFTHRPGTLGYVNYYTNPGMGEKFTIFTITTRWRAYPTQVQYNLDQSSWKTITANLQNSKGFITVPLTDGTYTLYFSESSSCQTTFSWNLYVPVDNSPSEYVTTMQYDVYGNVISVTDPELHTVSMSYSPEYGHAYRTEISTSIDSETLTTRATYDYYRGWITSTQKPKGVDAGSGYDTVYTHDVLGRVIKKEFPLLSGQIERSAVQAVYDCENRTVTIIDVLGHYTVQRFDRLGRLTRIDVYSGSYPSGILYASKTYSYRYDDSVSQVTDFGNHTTSYTYDFLGRYTQIVLPGTSVFYSYDDTNNKIVYTDGRGYDKTCWFSWSGELTEVEEEYAVNEFAVTTYLYDESGNLLSFTDPENQTTSYEYQSLVGLTRVVYPDSTYEQYTYDNIGNVVSYTDPEGNTTQFEYDNLYRLSQIVYEDQSTVSYEYDINSNRTRMVDNALSLQDHVDYDYDSWNRLITETRYLSGTGYSLSYQYDEGGRISALTYPEGTVILYDYDDFSRITGVTRYVDGINDEVLVSNTQYDTQGLLTQLDYGNSLTGSYSYNASSMFSSINLHLGEMDYLDLQYTYDSNNNITELAQGWRDTMSTWNADTISYTYDGLDRLTAATCDSWYHTYAYDRAGNRIGKDDITYTVNTLNQVTQLSDGTTFTYDLNGNMTEKTTSTDTYTYQFDPANRLQNVKKNGLTIGEYYYDGDGKRIKSTESAETTYIYAGLNVMYEKTVTGEAIYIYGPTGRIAKRTTIQQESHTFYYHPDHLGSTRLVTDESANIVVDVTYEPFGEPITTGEESYLYNGKEQDETGLYYYGARYYDPELGRFITRDPLAGQKVISQSLNRYSYCLNNPVKFVDPAGLFYKMCNVDSGVCTWIYETRSNRDSEDKPSWTAKDPSGDTITDSTEIESLLDPTGKTEEQKIEDQAQAAYLMLLITHPEIEGELTQSGVLILKTDEISYFLFIIEYEGEEHLLIIAISLEYSNTDPGRGPVGALALTGNNIKYMGKNVITMILFQGAFESFAHLYHVVGHEGVHAVQRLNRPGYDLDPEYTPEIQAYLWNYYHSRDVPYPWNFSTLLSLVSPYLVRSQEALPI